MIFAASKQMGAEERTIAWANLHPEEYDLACGLRAFGRDDLLKEDVHPMLVALFDQLFP